MVKKNLLGWHGRKNYSETVLRLQKTVAGFVKLRHNWQQGLATELATDQAFEKEINELLEEANAAFTTSRNVVRIIGAAAVLLEGAVEGRAERAKKKLEEGCTLPNALKRALEQERDSIVVNESPATKKIRKSPALLPLPSEAAPSSSSD